MATTLNIGGLTITEIAGIDCIGDSRVYINNNFLTLSTTLTALSSRTISVSSTDTVQHTYLSAARLLASNVRTNSIDSIHLKSSSVTTAKISAGAVTSDKINLETSLSSIGYQKMPGNLIYQWGTTRNSTVTFPVSFPNNLLHLQVTINNYDSLSAAPGTHTTVTSSGNTGFVVASAASTLSLSAALKWFGLGY